MIALEIATPADREVVNALAMEVHSLHVGWRPDIYEMPPEIYPAERFESALASDSLYVARQENGVVGYAAIKIRDYDWVGMVPRRILIVDELCVSRAHRRQGIGMAMMAALRELAKTESCTGLQLGVYPQNREAVAFYEACGFSLQSVTMSQNL